MRRRACMKWRFAGFLVALPVVCLAQRPAACQSPAVRDVWYECIDGDVRYGFLHLTVAELADGNFRYEVDIKVLLDLFGAQPQEITTRSEYVVTPKLRPVSLTSVSQSLTGETRVRGVAADGKLVVQVADKGDDRQVEVAIDGPDPPVFSLCLPDRVR